MKGITYEMLLSALEEYAEMQAEVKSVGQCTGMILLVLTRNLEELRPPLRPMAS
jgi:hypothetical protein